MKKSKKLLATLLGATILTSSLLAGGCAAPYAGHEEGALEGRPSYDTSASADTFTIWAYGQTCSDHYFINSEPIYFLDEFGNPVSMMTEERMDEWIEAGFNRVFINYAVSGETLDWTEEDWEASEVKKILDYCQTLGLKAFRHGSYANPLSNGRNFKDANGNYYNTRIQPDLAQGLIGVYYSEQYSKLKDAETRRLTALNEEDGSITASVRATLEATVKTEADAKEEGTFADDNAKTEWINSEIESRLATAVEAEIINRAEEYAEENKDEAAKWAHWRSTGVPQFFRSFDEYVEYAMNTMDFIIDHPAFLGWSLFDEPGWYELPISAEGCLVWKEAASRLGRDDIYMMQNMLPAHEAGHMKYQFCEGGDYMETFEAYAGYLNTYKELFIDTGALDYYQYDDYPVFHTNILESFLRCHQITAEFGRDNDVKTSIVMQSYGCDYHRFNQYEDVLWQANIGAAFGKTDFSYYTWWPLLNTTDGLLNDRSFPLTRFGERTQLFYSIADVNKELQYIGKYLTHFKFVDSTYLTVLPLPSGIGMIRDLQRPEVYNKLGVLTIDEESLRFKVSDGGILIVSEFYDEENDQKGYYVVNATDPTYASEAVVDLAFEGYNNVQIIQFQTANNVALKEGKIKIELGTGCGVFIMPY